MLGGDSFVVGSGVVVGVSAVSSAVGQSGSSKRADKCISGCVRMMRTSGDGSQYTLDSSSSVGLVPFRLESGARTIRPVKAFERVLETSNVARRVGPMR
eukprot:4979752-Prymnesium_polylepis.2